MDPIPDFEAGLEKFRSFLALNGESSSVLWLFRENMYKNAKNTFVVEPLPQTNLALARRAYINGLAMGQVSIDAIARLSGGVAATVWYPLSEWHRPQGWEQTFKVSMAEPLP